MIRDFDFWEGALGEVASLNELKGCRVAIEAADFLQKRILRGETTEPLVPALGGLPLGFAKHIEADLERFEHAQIEPYFIFSGLDLAKPADPFRARQQGAAVNAAAWALYDNHQAEASVSRFAESTYVQPEDLFRALQKVLVAKGVRFTVAPYSAWAQLSYLEQHTVNGSNDKIVHAVAGSSELLLFRCNKFITSWDFDSNQFWFMQRARCFQDLRQHVGGANVSEDTFVDACLLAGSHFLPTLQNLDNEQRKQTAKPRAAMEMIMNARGTGISVVLNNADDPKLKEMNYLENYRKARLAVKHHPYLTIEGKVVSSLEQQMPNDAHEFLGPQLPDEMSYYLSRGLINARILNWRTNSEIIEPPPVDGGESTEYRALVSSKITPLRTTAINLLSSSLHNWYQHKDLTLKCWFIDPPGSQYHTSTINMKDLPESRRIVEMWNVKDAAIEKISSQHKTCGYLGTAILALKDEDFVAKSSIRKSTEQPLSSRREIIFNSIWRFLTLREYVDQNHNLTAWGKVLATAIAALKGKRELEEAAVIAVELIRLGMLNWDAEMFPAYNGAPIRGDAKDRQFNLLISRVAGLGTLQHQPIGFTGPLSQHLLGYNSVINAVRSTVRDLVEVSATQIFTAGYAKRDMPDIPGLALQLPFLLPNNCALSIACKSYLDELMNEPDPSSPSARAKVIEMASSRYFPHALNFVGDLKTAFSLWDAVLEGVNKSGNLVKEGDKKVWNEAHAWLGNLR